METICRALPLDHAAFGVVLGVAYPPLVAVHAWQIEALERIGQEGWSTPRREYGATVVLAALFWLQSRNTFPSR